MKILINPREKFNEIKRFFGELFRYSMVGTVRLILTVLFIFVPQNLWEVNYILANLTGYAVILSLGFVLHKHWAFKSEGDWRNEAVLYLLAFLVSYLLNLGILVFAGELLHLGENISQGMAIATFSVTNFLMNKFWAFG